MTHQAGRKPRHVISTLAIAGLLALGTTSGFAQGKSGHGGGAASGNFGAQSSGRMAAQGVANTNGRYSIDRDFGRDRAAERMSDQGLAHNRIRDRDARVARDFNRNTNRLTGLQDDRDLRGANRPGFCPPGQAKKAGNGSHFNC